MFSSTANFFVAALAAASAVNAYPQMSSGTSTGASGSSRNGTTTKIQPVTPIATGEANQLIRQMKTAGTTVDRFKDLLTSNGDLLKGDELRTRTVFDFNALDVPAKGTKGAIALANIDDFPILTDLGVSVAMGFIGPCGLNTPHTHPRATEFLTLVDGDALESGFILENGFADADGKPFEVRSSLSKNQGTVFPVGSNHWQFNPTCKPVTFVASLSSEDPGVSQIAQNFFNLEGKVVEATLGFPESLNGEDLHKFTSQIPASVAEIYKQCAKQCGFKH